MMSPRTLAVFVLAFALFGLANAQGAAPSVDELADAGATLVAADAELSELRASLPDDSTKRGFDIGVALVGAQTEWGPGKQAFGEALPEPERSGYRVGALFAVNRNANVERSRIGQLVAASAAAIERLRAGADPRFRLGVDIASSMFGEKEQGAQGNREMGPGASAVRAALSAEARSGFDASRTANLARRGLPELAANTPWTMPDLTWMSVDEAWKAVPAIAGYGVLNPVVVETPHDHSIPLGHVRSTQPPAGTVLSRGQTIELRVPRPASRIGEGNLKAADAARRMGFDLDDDRYAIEKSGADIQVKWRDLQSRTDASGRGFLDGRGYYLVAADGARLFGEPRPDGRYIDLTAIGSHVRYAQCKRLLLTQPLKELPLDPGVTTGVCVQTTQGALAYVTFQAGEWTDRDEGAVTRNEFAMGAGDTKFHYAYFPKDPPELDNLKKTRIVVGRKLSRQ